MINHREFANTTADDQRNLFCGDCQRIADPSTVEFESGVYRIEGGQLVPLAESEAAVLEATSDSLQQQPS